MNLIQLRESKGLKASFVKDKLGIKSAKHFWRIEHGEGYLTAERITMLAKIYGCKKSEIVEASKEYIALNEATEQALRMIKEG